MPKHSTKPLLPESPLQQHGKLPPLPQLHTATDVAAPARKFPITVDCSVKIIRIGNINQAQQYFHCDFVLMAEWQCPDLKWSPHISVRNASNMETVFDTGNKSKPEGLVQRIQRLRGKLYQVSGLGISLTCLVSRVHLTLLRICTWSAFHLTSKLWRSSCAAGAR